MLLLFEMGSGAPFTRFIRGRRAVGCPHPRAVADRHGYDHAEHCLVTSGSTVVHGQRMRAGDYSYAGRGSVHEPIPSDEGALLFIVEAP